MLKLFKFLVRASRGMIALTVVAGLITGVCNAGLIALINETLHVSGISLQTMIWIFVGIAVTKLITHATSQILLSRFAHRVVAEMRRKLIRNILGVPLRHIENLGISRILASLVDDVQTITGSMFALPTMAMNVAILLAGSAYLCYLSGTAFLIMAGFIVLGIGSYRLLVVSAYRYVRLAREQQDTLFKHLRSLTEGIKELKIHRPRRHSFLEEKIQTATEALQNHNFSAAKRFVFGHSCSQVFLFGAIGFILFGLPQIQGISPEALTGYLLSFVYLMVPLSSLLNLLPGLGRANIALKKVEDLGISLESLASQKMENLSSESTGSWQRLRLQQVTHSYHREEDDNHFQLGPIDMEFEPGELVFLIGGNGSGKSTLAKVITGLYPPEQGAIFLDDIKIDETNRDAYRQTFSVVFSDFFLFESLLGLTHTSTDDQAQQYIERLRLSHKVKIKDGALSTTALSQGQRKRLALLTAYLEDRPFYVFDEWAADQDPVFKDVFYQEILPELKARGKTVLVITHDDRYLSAADRCFRMEEGRLQVSEVTKPVQETAGSNE